MTLLEKNERSFTALKLVRGYMCIFFVAEVMLHKSMLKHYIKCSFFNLGEMGVGLLKQYLEQQFSQISYSRDSSCILLSPSIQPGQLTNRYIVYVTAF